MNVRAVNVAAVASPCGMPAAVKPAISPASTTPMPPGIGREPTDQRGEAVDEHDLHQRQRLPVGVQRGDEDHGEQQLAGQVAAEQLQHLRRHPGDLLAGCSGPWPAGERPRHAPVAAASGSSTTAAMATPPTMITRRMRVDRYPRRVRATCDDRSKSPHVRTSAMTTRIASTIIADEGLEHARARRRWRRRVPGAGSSG